MIHTTRARKRERTHARAVVSSEKKEQSHNDPQVRIFELRSANKARAYMIFIHACWAVEENMHAALGHVNYFEFNHEPRIAPSVIVRARFGHRVALHQEKESKSRAARGIKLIRGLLMGARRKRSQGDRTTKARVCIL